VIDAPPSSLFSVILVEPDHVDRVLAHSALAAAGFAVTATNNYEDAHDALMARPPLVLVTTVRLGAHNGIQLALRAQAERPGIALVLTSSMPDAVLQAEADRLGATFVLKPVAPEDLMAAVYRTALRQAPAGALGSEPIRPPFERRRADRRVSAGPGVVDERRRVSRRRDIVSVLLGLPASV